MGRLLSTQGPHRQAGTGEGVRDSGAKDTPSSGDRSKRSGFISSAGMLHGYNSRGCHGVMLSWCRRVVVSSCHEEHGAGMVWLPLEQMTALQARAEE